MRAVRVCLIGQALATVVCALAVMQTGPTSALAGAKVVDTDEFSMELGLRLQSRMELERIGVPGGGTEWQRDFLVRRARLKANGKMRKATYNFEWKIDGTERAGATVGSPPSAEVENAYVQYPLGRGVELRAGLYDQPYSRDRLTSDSKQLAVDRGEVSNVPDAIGLADNVTGFEFLGKVNGGRAEYAAGLFDNRRIAGRLQDAPMVVGRLDLNFGSTKDIFRDAHFGEESWYSLGVNGSYQGSLDSTGIGASALSSNAAAGIDGMLDIPAGDGRLFVKGEVSTIKTKRHDGGQGIDTSVWMVGAGFLTLDQRLQPFVRFDQIRFDSLAGGGTRDITFVGANFYQNGHNLKIQGDVRLQANTSDSVDGVRLQAQIDF